MLLSVLLAAQLGAVPLAAADWSAPWLDVPLSGSAHVLWQLRLPRVLLAAVIGAALGLAGGLAQGLFRNPLADPGLLGVSSGAACAAALTLTVFASLQYALAAGLAFVVAAGGGLLRRTGGVLRARPHGALAHARLGGRAAAGRAWRSMR